MARLVRWIGIVWVSFVLLTGLILSATRIGNAPHGWIIFSHCPRATTCNIYRIQPDQKHTQFLATRHFDPNQFDASGIFISPDEQWLYFSSNSKGNIDLYRVRINGIDFGLLTSMPGMDYLVGWSPNGQWIIFNSPSSTANHVFQMRPDGSEVKPISSKKAIHFIQWIDNDTALINVERQLYAYSLVNSQLQLISHNNDFQTATVSPDGQWLIAMGQYKDQFGILRLNTQTANPEPELVWDLTYSNAGLSRIIHEPTNQWLIFEFVGMFQGYLLSVKTDGSEAHRLTPGQDGFAAWSPDQEWVLYYAESSANRPQGLFRVRIDGTDTRQIATPNEVEYGASIHWSPDGQWLLFINWTGLARMRSDGSDFQKFAGDFSTTHWATWSPDNKWIIFNSEKHGNNNLYRMRIDGSDRQQLTDFLGDVTFEGWLNSPIEMPWHRVLLLVLGIGGGVCLILSIHPTPLKKLFRRR